uniref:Ig-like domain-containing protein n=1 Tax=Amphiprion percula TaxID=161767 RepID=A0A3P8UEU5_AMPPE
MSIYDVKIKWSNSLQGRFCWFLAHRESKKQLCIVRFSVLCLKYVAWDDICVLQVSGMRIYTSGEVEAVNGTDVRLKCTFESSSPININLVVISWTFRPLGPGREESVFHFQQRPYPPVEGIFRKRIVWAGDVMGRDASIIIREVKFTYNGTYICQVKNPPDVHGSVGQIKLRVVTTGQHVLFSKIFWIFLLLITAVKSGPQRCKTDTVFECKNPIYQMILKLYQCFLLFFV